MIRLLIGLGNPDRGDDGVGVAVLGRLTDRLPPGVEALRLDDPSCLLDAWDGADEVVVVDAVTSGRDPGSVVTLDVTHHPLPAHGWGSGGTHALGLAAAVELSRALGRMPRRLVVVGVESSSTVAGAGLSDPVAAGVEPAAAAVLQALGSGEL